MYILKSNKTTEVKKPQDEITNGKYNDFKVVT